MQFSRFFDLQDDLLSELIDDSSSSTGQKFNMRVVGQEQNHELLLVWDDFLPFSSPKMIVTFLGSYHPNSKQFMKLFTFESTLHITNCSISPDRCVIAYTCRHTRQGQSWIYSGYLAEVHNRIRTCIYSLNLHHHSLIKVQFLWPFKNFTDADPDAKQSRLLVLLHNKSVGVYTINLRRTGMSMVLHSLPVAEQICGSFIWAQWDQLNQRLFLLVSRTKSGKTKNIFRCLEFLHGGATPTPAIEMELPFPIKEHHFQRNSYQDLPLHTVSEDSFNMKVITQAQGILCICYQHALHKPRRLMKTVSFPLLRAQSEPSTVSLSASRLSSECPVVMTSSSGSQPTHDLNLIDDLTKSLPTSLMESYTKVKKIGSGVDQMDLKTHLDVSYSILSVHTASIISVKVHQVPRERTKQLKLFFGAQDGYIFVYSPGIVQHLLNVSPEFRSCHHVALDPAEVDFSCSNDKPTSSKLEYITCGGTSRSGGTCIFDITHQTAFHYTWNRMLPFKSVHPCLAKPLLHFAIIQARDSQMRDEIMYHFTKDPTDADLFEIFLEFIISSTYAAVRKQVDDRDILACFPFSTEISTQQLLQTHEGGTIATFTTSMSRHKVEFSTERHKKRWWRIPLKSLDPLARQKTRKLSYLLGHPYLFSRLQSHLERLKESDKKPNQRYSTMSLKEKIDGIPKMRITKSSADKPREFPSPSLATSNSTIKRATESIMKLAMPGRKKRKVSSVVQPSVQTIPMETEDDWYYIKTREMHMEALQHHLSQHLTYVSPDKISQIATSYCDCQIQQVTHLKNILTRSTGSSPDVWDLSLNTAPSVEDQSLLQLMERVYLTTELYCLLVPKDFVTNFVCLGFRCLDFQSFLQHVKQGIFQLNKKFLLKLLKDLPDDEKVNRDKKKLILSMLPSRDLEIEMLRTWNHPDGNGILTKIYLKNLWFSETVSSQDHLSDGLDSPSANFPPLASLLRYTQRLGKASSEMDYKMSLSQIASAALLNTIQSCGEDLQRFTF